MTGLQWLRGERPSTQDSFQAYWAIVSAGAIIPHLSGRIVVLRRSKTPAGEALPCGGGGRGNKGVELYGRLRHAVQIEGLSHREAARRFGIDPRTVRKMMLFSVPPGYRRSKLAARPNHEIKTPFGDRAFSRRTGEALHTERETLDTLATIRTTMRTYNRTGQYQ